MPSIKDIANSVRNNAPRKKTGKSNRTHAFAEPHYKLFADYCRGKGKFPSDVLDDLIAMFLEEVKDDLPAAAATDEPDTKAG